MKYLLALLLSLQFALPCAATPFEGVSVPDYGGGLPNYTYAAKITSAYDADTVTADIDLGFSVALRGEKIRLYGINAPEIRGEEREKGLAARAFLVDLLAKPWKRVFILTIKDKKEKYGRYLGILLLEGEDGKLLNVNGELVRAGHAVIEKY